MKVADCSTHWFIELGIFILSLLALGIKLKTHPARRTRNQLAKDGIKQLAGAGGIHFMNIIVSDQLVHSVNSEQVDACAWYFVQIMFDTTLGVFVAMMIFGCFLESLSMELRMELVQSEREEKAKGAEDSNQLEDAQTPLVASTVSKDAPSLMATLKQTGIWVLVLLLMKATMVAFIYSLATPLQALAMVTLQFIPDSFEVYFVKMVIPFIMNTIQYWIFDNMFIDKYDDLMRKVDSKKKYEIMENKCKNADELNSLIHQLKERHNDQLRDVTEKNELLIKKLAKTQGDLDVEIQKRSQEEKKFEDLEKKFQQLKDKLRDVEHERFFECEEAVEEVPQVQVQVDRVAIENSVKQQYKSSPINGSDGILIEIAEAVEEERVGFLPLALNAVRGMNPFRWR